MLCDAGLTRAMAGRPRDALRCMQEALSYVPALDEPQLIGSLASALTLEGRAREARPLFAQVERYLDDVEPLSPEGQTVVLCLTPRTWLGEFEAGDRHLERWVGRARDAGCLAYIGFPQAFGAELDFRRGRWRDALARSDEAVRSLEETGQFSPLAFALVTLAQVEAGIGREADCQAHAARAMAIAGELGLGSIPVYRGLRARPAGPGAGAPGDGGPAASSRSSPSPTRPASASRPRSSGSLSSIEGYLRVGRARDARRALRTLAEQAVRTDGAWARAVTARCRGLLDEDIDRHFREALGFHDGTPMPFERARTELAYGARLRRVGAPHRRRASTCAGPSPAFDGLGADPWARRAREEIAASGAGLPARGGPRADELSPRERQTGAGRRGGAHQPGGRGAAVRLGEDRRAPPRERLPQARPALPHRARATDRGRRPRALRRRRPTPPGSPNISIVSQ